MTSLDRHLHRPALRALLLSLLLVTAAATDLVAAPYVPPSSNRSSISLSGSWKFIKGDVVGCEAPTFDDSAWTTAVVPHTWNNIDGQDGPDIGGDAAGRNYYRGIAWYRRHVSIPTSLSGRRLFLQFDGASLVAEVWVNGIYVGRHEGGFTRFRFDVTAVLNTAPGNDNLIAVKVDNSNAAQIAPLAGDFTVFGGLYRDVSLVATDRLAAEMLDFGSSGVYLSQTSVSHASASVQIKTLVSNGNLFGRNATIKSVIVDSDGEIVRTASTAVTISAQSTGSVVQNVTIGTPRLWDGPDDPYLYSVHVEIHEGAETGPVRDVVPPQPLGLRYYSLDSNRGFLLNGRDHDLRGVNRHQDRLDKGWAISESDQDEDMALIREIGATAVRLAHYPHAQYFYSLADRNGLVVWAEIPLLNRVGGAAFSANAKQQLVEMIRQSYNHPSIIFWGLANEILISPTPDPNPLLTELNALAKKEDPYRITTLAHCCGGDSDPTTTRTDTFGYNKYFGWYDLGYDYFALWVDSAHAINPTRGFSISEYGAGGSIAIHAQNPPLSFSNHTEEYQALFHEAHWLAMKVRPYLWGTFVWNMFDFASDGRTEGDTNGRNDKGLVTYDRQTRKDSFYWYKANWTTTPMVYITSRRWTQRTNPNTEIKIYSNAESVTLIVNGTAVSTVAATASPDRIFRWTSVALRSGSNTVEAIGRVGAETVTDTVNWTVGTTGGNQPPTVAILSPIQGATFTAPANIAVTVAAADSDGTVSKVEFFDGTTKLGEDSSPSGGWTLGWTDVPAGSYTLTAVATDDDMAAATSLPISIFVSAAANQPPTVVVPAAAIPPIVPGTTTALSVLAADDGGESNLTYTWTTTGTAPAPVSFSVNGTNAARNAVASFSKAGSYTFQVTIRDASGRSVSSSVPVSVVQTLRAIRVSPATATVLVTGMQPFSATASDQFAHAMSAQPAFAWTVNGGGTISSTGVFTAGAIPGTVSVAASAAGRSGSAAVTVLASGGFSVNINFQPSDAPPYFGYLVDSGAAFADRGNGYSYGWSQDNTAGARDRNNLLSPDQRYDTLVHMGDLTWEIAVPNGTYSVRTVLGDPSYPDVNARLTVEGVLTITGATNAANPWLQGTGTVTVTDGRLTIGNQAGSYSKICFVEITSAAANPNQPPSVGITSPANGAIFAMPATVTIAATAADSDGTVARVEFFDGTARLGEDTNGSDGWSLLWTNVPAGTHSLTARATDNAAATATSSTVSFTVAALSVLRIDVGSTSGLTDSAGRAWQPDQFGSGGTVSSKPDPIGNTSDDNLYRTYRFGAFTYDIPAANGTYEVQLGFIETWWTGPGQRIFSVAAEGITKVANVDLYAAGGKFNAIDRTFSVDVTDGILSLAFTSSIDNAIVSTITITRLP